MQSLGGQQGKLATQIEAHLVTEDADRTNSGTVMFFNAVVEDVANEVQVSSHKRSFTFGAYT
jgi:hypothetical protein